MLLIENQKKTSKVSDITNFQQEFYDVLAFATELCEIPHAFISFFDTDKQIIKVNVDFDFLLIPESVLFYQQDVIQQNKIHIVTDIAQHTNHELNILNPFSFFAGFPICINKNLVVGSLCIIDTKPKLLSPIELKSLNRAVSQIQFLLELDIQNNGLQKIVQEKENQLALLTKKFNNIFYELNIDRTINSVSENWTASVGYKINEVIGENTSKFIHPDDIEKTINFLNKLTLGVKNNQEIIYRVLHKDGYYIWHSSCVELVKKGNKQFYVGNCRDITINVKTLQDLLPQKEFYEKILDRLPIDISVWDYNRKYTYLNPAAIKNNKMRKFITEKDDFEHIRHIDKPDIFTKNLRVKFIQAVQTRDTVEWEDMIQLKNGQKTYYTRKFAPVFSENGTLDMMLCYGIDITESKKDQEEILKIRQLTDNVIENVAIGILVQNPQSEIVKSNNAACTMLGLSVDEVLGKTSFDGYWRAIKVDGTDFKVEEFPVSQAIQKLKPINNIVMGLHLPLNNFVWLLVDAVPVFSDYNELLYVICSFKDITLQKNAENALKISSERLKSSSETISDLIWDWNIIADEIYVGESFSALFGHKLEGSIIGKQEYESYIHPEDKSSYFKSIEKAISSDVDKWSYKYRYLKAGGENSYLNSAGVIMRNDEGQAIRVIGVTKDITEEIKMNNKLQQREQLFKEAFEHSFIGVALVSPEGHWNKVNNKVCQMLGYSKEELKLLTFQDVTHPEDLQRDSAELKKLIDGEIFNYNIKKRYINKNKTIIYAHLSVSLVRNDRGEIINFMSQIIDITDRKKIEEENKLLIDLNEAKNMYRLLANNTIDLVCLHNLDTSFQYLSPSIKKLLGYTADELIGRFPREFVHPDDFEILQNSILGFMNEVQDVVIRVRLKNVENNYFWFEIKAVLVKENGIPINFQSSTRNITPQKEAEKIVENTLIQERELNELRTNLISTISHEFRTPMTTIRTSAELINMYLEGCNFKNSSHVAKRVDTITEEIDRIVELMDAVLTISKDDAGKTSFNPVELDLKQVCIDVTKNYCSDELDKRKVKMSFDGDFFPVFADINLMKYSLFNLLNNAYKYSKGSGDVILKLFINEGQVVVEIIDFGIGIPEEDQTKVFNTFFRASNTVGIKGTGLGLYIIKTFSERNSGTVKLQSKLGKGTKVTLQFPLLTY